MSADTVTTGLIDRQLGRRGLLGLGGALLIAGWGGTAILTRLPGVVGGDPRTAAVGLWIVVFALIVSVAVVACPPRVRVNRVNIVWVVLNTTALVYTVSAVVGALPTTLVQYAYWHVWVLTAVVGFAATGALLEGAGTSGQLYFTAAGLELSLLFLGIGAFGTLVPGLYLLLAVVHPTPLVLDALPVDLTPGWTAAAQLGSYVVGLGAVLLF